MPALTEKQRRFMGMVAAYKKGKLKSPSAEVKRAAGGMSARQALDFAKKEKSRRIYKMRPPKKKKTWAYASASRHSLARSLA